MLKKLIVARIKKLMGIASPSSLYAHGYKYEYDWLKAKRKQANCLHIWVEGRESPQMVLKHGSFVRNYLICEKCGKTKLRGME